MARASKSEREQQQRSDNSSDNDENDAPNGFHVAWVQQVVLNFSFVAHGSGQMGAAVENVKGPLIKLLIGKGPVPDVKMKEAAN